VPQATALCLLAFLCLPAGCGVRRAVGLAKTPALSLQVNVTARANGNAPVAVDLVSTTDKKILAELSKLSAKDWFDRRRQFQRDFPDKVSIASWEWVPGQQVEPIAISLAPKSRGAFVFAQYLTPGDHRATLDISGPALLTLGEDDFTVQALR